jgi:DNA mismatch repair protein MutL
LGAIPLMDFDNDSPLDIPVFHADRGNVRIPTDALNPDFNPFNISENQQTTPRNGRASGGGGYLRNMPYSHDGVPAGWERLYEESYDTFDPASSGGDSFRNLILGEQEQEEEEAVFVSQGFENEEESSDEAEFFSEEEAFQGALEIDSGLAAGFPFLNLSNRYIALASGQGLTLIDLPRAHHRVLYERFLHQNTAQLAVNQQELFPEPIPLSADDQKLLQEVRDDLLAIGFDIRVEGENAVVRGIPADFQATPAARLVDSLLHDLRQNGLPAAENRRKAVALMLADAYSLRNARTMQREEIEELILSLYDCSEPAFTADGRAVWSLISSDEIKKRLQ